VASAVSISGPFNACEYLLDRHVRAGLGDRLALTGVAGDVSYDQLAERVGHAARGLRGLGLQAEQRIVMVMTDSPEFVIVYLAAMRMGAVPVPISTMLRADGIAEILADSRARGIAVSAQYLDLVADALGYPGTGAVMAVVTDDAAAPPTIGGLATTALGELPAVGPDDIYPTTADSPAFWLYTSGTTGTPKGAMHRHGSVRVVCETYGTQVLGITPDDRCLSAAKAFGRDRVLVALRRLAPGVPGGVAAHRRHLRRGRGRVLRLPGPHRGHAQGQRDLGLPG
jgi:acyl-coenzyme A synthetase/AMP-(fatty) acid ligase